ncbi:MAG: hypothetical protein LQ339_008076 [Xanthoria mediterranea]|nr:MAG: hypothetical protein LQ339_008076 [Xanthoria mediterranea]
MAFVQRSSAALFLAALFLAALLGSALADPEFSRRGEPDSLLQGRGICYDDDTFRSFKYWRVDAEPYCSKLLNIQDVTSTLGPATSRTTTTTVSSSVRTLPTTTVAKATAYSTVTITAGDRQKRENAATVSAEGYVQSMLSGANTNASIASSVYSACSCLSITPKTVSTQSTVQTTRTITGSIDATEAAATVTSSGTSTLTVTEIITIPAQGNYYPYQVYGSSSSLASSSSAGVPLSASSIPSDTAPIISSGRASAIPSNTTLFFSSGVASLVLSGTTPSLSTAPINGYSSYSTGNGSGPRGGSSAASTTYTATLPAVTLPSYVPSIIPSNTTSSQTPESTNIGVSIDPEGCPGINNTIWTNSYGQQFQLQCYRFYAGPISIGLDQPHFRECMEQCSLVNAGFSAIRCYGVTWLKFGDGIHCNLKGQSALASYTTNYQAVSAVLLSGVVQPIVGLFRGAGAGSGNVGGKTQTPDDNPGTWRMAKRWRRLGLP